ncbi:FKBP-type peptidyl-prolyl cis-trans isomerase N-terminal domain-containing protein [Serratia quinivorans]
MKSTVTLARCHVLALMAAGTVFLPCQATGAPSGVPALLQFAEQYQAPARTDPAKPAPKGNAVTPPSPQKGREKPGSTWQLKEAELKRQQVTITQLEHQVSLLQQALTEKPAPVPPVDLKGLHQLALGVRQALALTPGENQAQARGALAQQQLSAAQKTEKTLQADKQALTAQLSALNTQHTVFKVAAEKKTLATAQQLTAQLSAMAQDKATLQSHLSRAQKESQVLTATAEELKIQLGTANAREKSLLQQQGELQTQRHTLQAQIDSQINEVATLKGTLAPLQQAGPAAVTPEALKMPQTRQDYAAGVSLGEEILQMQAERKVWGVDSDKQVMLAGIVDTFAGHKKLPDDELNQALAAAEKQVTAARDKVIAGQEKKGAQYLSTFKQDKQARQTASGAWYRIDYAGDAAIPAGATLDVVIKEALVDGTVIHDMENNGAVLSQPMDRFPPVFREALSQLKNHGTLTLVVPPALAYGEKGYPPNVPPKATMVYTLRITEVYAAKASISAVAGKR